MQVNLSLDATDGVGAFDSFGIPLKVVKVSGLDIDEATGQYPLGAHDVTYTATDAAGNTATLTRRLIVHTRDGYYGRVVNDAANLGLWQLGDRARLAGSVGTSSIYEGILVLLWIISSFKFSPYPAK
jgi:hypothetical protein